MHDSFGSSSPEDARHTVQRYEQMLAAQEAVFFDLSDFELLIDHYTTRHEYSRALRACELALDQYPFSHELLIDKAQLLAMTGRTQEALRLIDEVALVEMTNPDVSVTRGLIYSQLADYARAIAFFKEALTSPEAEGRDDILFNIALAYQSWGKLRAAATYYQKSLALNSDNDAAVQELLHCLEETQQLPVGITFFQQAVDADPYDARAWFNLGAVRYRLHQYEPAKEAFEYATLIDAQFFAAYNYLGQCLVAQGAHREALMMFEQGFVAGEPTVEALCNMGECHEKLAEWPEAKAHYQRALELDAEADEAWYGLGVILCAQDRWFEAIHFIRKAIDLYDQSGEYWLGLARAEYEVGNVVSALEAFERATNAEPASTTAWVAWAGVLQEQGHYEEAADLLRAAIEADPTDAELHYRTCACLLSAGRYREAYQYLENGLALAFEKHPLLFELLPELAGQRALTQLIEQYRK